MLDAPGVVVVDGPTLCREGLTALLSQAGCSIVASTSDGDEALASVEESHPTLLLLALGQALMVDLPSPHASSLSRLQPR